MFRSVFFGTPEFSVPALQALANISEVVCVFSQPDRPRGRGQILQPTPIKLAAESLKLRVEQPEKINTPDFQTRLAMLAPDVAVVVAYGRILPSSVLNTPRRGCVNVHASLLPRWRGAAPIQRAIEAGDKETGVCLMRMDEGLDTGEVFDVAKLSIGDNETAGELSSRIARLGAERLAKVLANYVSQNITPQPQSTVGITYAHKITKAEASIQWSNPAADIHNKVRAFQPSPGVWADIAYGLGTPVRMKLISTEMLPAETHIEASPGHIIPERQAIMSADRPLKVLKVQLPGKKAIGFGDWLSQMASSRALR